MKISQVLRETKVPQVRSFFISFNDIGDVDGKCALGVLACESPDESLHLSEDKRHIWDEFDKLFTSYGIENIKGLPRISSSNYDWDFEKDSTLATMIMRLNDWYGLTFKEIADFLEITLDL